MLSWLCLAEHFFKGLQSKGPRSLRHAPTLEGDAEGTVTGGAGVRDQGAVLRGLVLPGQLPGLGQGAGTRGWEKLALATFNSGHQSLTAPWAPPVPAPEDSHQARPHPWAWHPDPSLGLSQRHGISSLSLHLQCSYFTLAREQNINDGLKNQSTSFFPSPSSDRLSVFSEDLKEDIMLLGSPHQSQVVNKASVYISLKVISIIFESTKYYRILTERVAALSKRILVAWKYSVTKAQLRT